MYRNTKILFMYMLNTYIPPKGECGGIFGRIENPKFKFIRFIFPCSYLVVQYIDCTISFTRLGTFCMCYTFSCFCSLFVLLW